MTNDTEIIDDIITIADDMKAEHIKIYDLKGQSILTDTAIILTVKNQIHAQSVIEKLETYIKATNRASKQDDVEVLSKSKNTESGWSILDLNSVIVHIMSEPIRDRFDLDTLLENTANSVHHHP